MKYMLRLFINTVGAGSALICGIVAVVVSIQHVYTPGLILGRLCVVFSLMKIAELLEEE